jgi:hypothetical protein
MGFGKSKYTTGTTFKRPVGPKKGDNIRRVLPAMHSLAESGEWSYYVSTHWGYHGVSKREPGKTVPRPFRCIKVMNWTTKMVIQACPKCDQREQVEAQKKEQEAQLVATKAPKDVIESALQPLEDWLEAHNCERKHIINTMCQDGTFEPFKLNSKFHMPQLREKFKELVAQGIDPTDVDQGVWINVKRTTNDGADTIEVVNEAVPGMPGAFRLKLAPLSEEQKERALSEVRDLTEHGGVVLTFDQIAQLVACDGTPEEVDRIMGLNSKEQSAPARASSPAPAAAPATLPKTALPPASAAPVAKAAVAPSSNAPAADIKAMLEERRQKIESAAKAKAAQEAAAKAAEQAAAVAQPAPEQVFNPLELSDEAFIEFMRQQDATAANQ